MSCALWENEIAVEGTTKTVLKASVSRRYKDKNGDWKSSQSFSRNEIPLAVWCLEKAFEKIIVELKALKTLADKHRAQVHNYLKATDYKLGLLVNFGHFPKVEYERTVV